MQSFLFVEWATKMWLRICFSHLQPFFHDKQISKGDFIWIQQQQQKTSKDKASYKHFFICGKMNAEWLFSK